MKTFWVTACDENCSVVYSAMHDGVSADAVHRVATSIIDAQYHGSICITQEG